MADELRELAKDLRESSEKVKTGAYGVVKKAAVNIKRDWRANAEQSSGSHAKYYPRTISFDISRPDKDEVIAVIGPAGRGQGELGPILEFGSPTSPPHMDGARAMREEAPRLEKALADLAEDVL